MPCKTFIFIYIFDGKACHHLHISQPKEETAKIKNKAAVERYHHNRARLYLQHLPKKILLSSKTLGFFLSSACPIPESFIHSLSSQDLLVVFCGKAFEKLVCSDHCRRRHGHRSPARP